MPDVPALFQFSMLLRREDAHPSRRFFYLVFAHLPANRFVLAWKNRFALGLELL
ncbi:hypothetical protein [Rhizobium vallis]|uniref:hypothetical protein n=1 Tax=Rhizobium vallis TaxID=634290 RepID=UPI0013E02249|nr:hypothetical protein [Rhizobium vallis]